MARPFDWREQRGFRDRASPQDFAGFYLFL
jgi:hypothetical protein